MKVISEKVAPLAINAGKRWANSGRKPSIPNLFPASADRHFHKSWYIQQYVRAEKASHPSMVKDPAAEMSAAARQSPG